MMQTSNTQTVSLEARMVLAAPASIEVQEVVLTCPPVES